MLERMYFVLNITQWKSFFQQNKLMYLILIVEFVFVYEREVVTFNLNIFSIEKFFKML